MHDEQLQGEGGVKRKRDSDNNDMDDINFMGLSDMCAPEVKHIIEYQDGYDFYDESSGEWLSPQLVAEACQEELKMFDTMKV